MLSKLLSYRGQSTDLIINVMLLCSTKILQILPKNLKVKWCTPYKIINVQKEKNPWLLYARTEKTRWKINPANIRLDEAVLKTSFVFVFRRRLPDVLIKTNMFALALRLQKTSSRCLGQDPYIHLGHTSSRRLQHVFKTSSRRLAKISSRRFQGVSSS